MVGLGRTNTRLRAVLAAGCCASAALAAPALGDGSAPGYPGSVLHVALAGPLKAGKVLDIVATGTNAINSLGLPIDYGLEVILVDPSNLPGPCQDSYNTELTDVTDNPQAGRLLTFESLNEGVSGPFKISLPFTPGGSGELLVCAYTEFITDDAAWASTEGHVVPAGAQRPVNSAPPRVTRSGNRLSCARGTWSARPRTYSYRWLEDPRTRLAGRRASLSVTRKLRGHRVQCTVTATNAAGSATATSRPLLAR